MKLNFVKNSNEVWSKRFNIELNVLENKVESAFERIIDLETKPQVRFHVILQLRRFFRHFSAAISAYIFN